jgi:hypothetical protein
MKTTTALALGAFLLAVTSLTPLPVIAEDGHCNYTQQNMFAGPFKVCQMPASSAQCEELGSTDENHDAVHGEGSCGTADEVGTCDLGDQQIVYYEGEPGGLEIGCGFQGGDWIAAG